MTKKVCCTVLAMAMLFVSPLFAAEKKLGKGVSVKTATPVKELLTQPEKYLGKVVMVEGEMMKVCQDAGCWTLVKDASYADPILIKVPDGVIVFPKDGAGRKIAAQGTLVKISQGAQTESGSLSPYGIAGSGAILK